MFGFEGDNAREKVIVLLTMCFALAMAMLDNTVVNVALPSIKNDLGAGFSQLQWIVDGYVLAFASLLLTGGILGRPIRAQEDVPHRGRGVHPLLVPLRRVADPRPADRLPRPSGRRRRAAASRDAVDPHRDVPRARAGEGARDLGRRVGYRARARTDARRLHGRAHRLGVGVLPQRADRDRRASSSPLGPSRSRSPKPSDSSTSRGSSWGPRPSSS